MREIKLRGAGIRIAAELRPGVELRVGRHASNQIVLDARSVSRFHARIVWPAGCLGPRIFDCGSQNGTFVDGREALAEVPQPLSHGARLRLGEALLDVLLEDSDGSLALLAPEHDHDRVALPTDDGPELTGRLEGADPARRLLLALEQQGRTGLLEVTLPGGAVRLTLGAGRVMHVWDEQREGLDALRGLLSGAKGGQPFRFTRELEMRDDPPLCLPPTCVFRSLETSRMRAVHRV